MTKRRQNSWQTKHTPRGWQEQALKEWKKDFKGVVSVVTGGGKTLFAFFCACEFKKAFPEKRILVIVPTLTLLDQWYLGFEEDLGISKEQISCFSGQEKPKEFNEVNLLVINTARTVLQKLKEKNEYLLIVDECHRAGSPANSESIKGNYAATLGLSATPDREYDLGLKKYIIPRLGRIIYSYDYLQALNDNVISPFELVNVEVNLLPHEEREFNKVTKKLRFLFSKKDESEDDKSKIERLLIRRARISNGAMIRVPVAVKLTEENKNQKTIIFHESIEGANTILKMFNERGETAVIYHSGIGPEMRRDNLRLFKKGIFNVLVTCKALDEGMNVPKTSVAIIASSTASTRQRIQRLGRVLRPATGKNKAYIYTIYASNQEKQRLVKEYKKLQEHIDIKWIKTDFRLNG
ncbi:DEAD/DEAH box helicase [Galbibacter sp. EGI 63066]|uniref:DEAD/DEAH box helicase n=1 Tax=Galbibacter sp. EGI 63066 TaxID=2993559 RepID=UPI002248E4F7|nr:DEAD/DEAH box helicase [Galbibacter sp. EGI 63066]MCX2679021.1 DEAD/DEAH box helicase [Galbibacter sp. EGI 63066]